MPSRGVAYPAAVGCPGTPSTGCPRRADPALAAALTAHPSPVPVPTTGTGLALQEFMPMYASTHHATTRQPTAQSAVVTALTPSSRKRSSGAHRLLHRTMAVGALSVAFAFAGQPVALADER